ncbi:hypothetical protein [Nocardia sp. XZ_19_385]|uniref:hypothetical protein n=1 Tax=Nocardia sp. XZ_19_385 TaxID=2769488 RepID=UPI00188F368A|nr:hypothetical protein [Nocardia sp. XZ_19_385]
MTTLTYAKPRTSWPILLLRAASTGVAVLVLLQAALAGSFLSGEFAALAAHARNARIMAAFLLIQLIAAIVCKRAGLATKQPVLASVAQCVVTAALIPLGEQRILAVHLPLAVLLVVGVLHLTYTAWRRIPEGPQ